MRRTHSLPLFFHVTCHCSFILGTPSEEGPRESLATSSLPYGAGIYYAHYVAVTLTASLQSGRPEFKTSLFHFKDPVWVGPPGFSQLSHIGLWTSLKLLCRLRTLVTGVCPGKGLNGQLVTLRFLVMIPPKVRGRKFTLLHGMIYFSTWLAMFRISGVIPKKAVASRE